MPPFRLYLISDEVHFPGKLEALLPSLMGVSGWGLQLREKHLSPRAQVQWIKRLQTRIPEQISAPWYLNDRADLAVSLGLAGVHLREESCPCETLHPFFKQALSVGVSTHSLEGVLRAQAGGAEFVTLGPIYPTPSKATYGEPLGLERLAEVTAQVKIPVFALGGVTPERVQECLEAGAYGVAAIAAIWGASAPLKALEAFQQELLRAQITRQSRRIGSRAIN